MSAGGDMPAILGQTQCVVKTLSLSKNYSLMLFSHALAMPVRFCYHEVNNAHGVNATRRNSTSAPSDYSKEEVERRILSARMNQQALPKRRGCGCIHGSLGLIAFFVLGSAFIVAFDSLYAPWAWGWGGRPTLTGEWLAQFRLPSGQRGAAYLNMSHNPNDDFGGSRLGPNLPRLNGTAQGCFASGIQNYSLNGEASGKGDNVILGFSAKKPTVPDYALHELKGKWDGTTLSLSGTFTRILDTQGSTQLKTEPNQTQPTTIVFSKADAAEFRKQCQSLGQ
jgi:hypothetical protein